ncbi:PepSY-like domain-containing protein [Pedobacter arcticus]|uniref:PepSY-like domain-containing protein n=1 Tax=Pedobacter arcticus TaxID=752140 RepID=UPI000379C80A|nr:PepSY-like domain-containing protein [Pedobacter arcticus]
MKTLKIATLITFVSLAVNAQNLPTSQVPLKALTAFENVYPQVINAEWELKGENYEVEFEIGRLDHEIRYNKEGKLIKMKKEIEAKDLPKSITNAVKVKYPKYKIDEIETTQFNSKTTYKVEIAQFLGKERTLLFEQAGKLVSDLAN